MGSPGRLIGISPGKIITVHILELEFLVNIQIRREVFRN
jgi:hypothetical protein